MVSYCANPACAKPLHYLREGRIFIFDVADSASDPYGRRLHHLEHYWLCGRCCEALLLRREGDEIRVLQRPRNSSMEARESSVSGLAS